MSCKSSISLISVKNNENRVPHVFDKTKKQWQIDNFDNFYVVGDYTMNSGHLSEENLQKYEKIAKFWKFEKYSKKWSKKWSENDSKSGPKVTPKVPKNWSPKSIPPVVSNWLRYEHNLIASRTLIKCIFVAIHRILKMFDYL